MDKQYKPASQNQGAPHKKGKKKNVTANRETGDKSIGNAAKQLRSARKKQMQDLGL